MSSAAEPQHLLTDSQNRHLGDIVLESRDGSLVLGRFTPSDQFADIQQLFRAFEEAADLQALSVVEETGRAIDALGLSLTDPSGARTPIHDVQIWGDGAMSCRLSDAPPPPHTVAPPKVSHTPEKDYSTHARP